MEARLKRNVLFMALDAVVTIVASLTQLAFITRGYEPYIVGEYQFVQAMLFLIGALSCAGGVAMVAARDLTTKDPSQREAIISHAVVLLGIVSIAITLLLFLVFRQWSSQSHALLAILVGSIVSLVASMAQLSQTLIVSAEQISRVASISIASNVLATIVVACASRAHVSLTGLVVSVLSYQVLRGVFATTLARSWRYVSFDCIERGRLWELFKQAFPVLIMIVATHLYVRIDIVMLECWTDHNTVARYGSAYAFLDQLMILSNFMMGALFPNFAKAAVLKGREYRTLYRGILILFGKYLVPIATLIALFSRSLLTGVYGLEYADAGPALSILMLAALFAWLNGPAGTIFITLGKQSIYMWATIVSLVVNLLANGALIPIVGAVGSAIATVLTEAALCGFCLVWIRRETGWLPWMRIEESWDE